jgi:hypothetical protein
MGVHESHVSYKFLVMCLLNINKSAISHYIKFVQY